MSFSPGCSVSGGGPQRSRRTGRARERDLGPGDPVHLIRRVARLGHLDLVPLPRRDEQAVGDVRLGERPAVGRHDPETRPVERQLHRSRVRRVQDAPALDLSLGRRAANPRRAAVGQQHVAEAPVHQLGVGTPRPGPGPARPAGRTRRPLRPAPCPLPPRGPTPAAWAARGRGPYLAPLRRQPAQVAQRTAPRSLVVVPA